MELITNKSVEKIRDKILARLQELGVNVTPGSIARLFSIVMAEELGEFYKDFNTAHLMYFLSTAKEQFLDAIGALVNCFRITDETDEDYRYRISKSTLTLAKANETCIRITALMVQGVQDVVLQKASHGPGTFSVIIINDGTNLNVINDVYNATKDVAAYGVKVQVYEPINKSVKLKIKLQYQQMTDSEAFEIKQYVTNVIRQFLSSRGIGQEFNTQELTRLILNVDSRIKKFSPLQFVINTKTYDFININCRWNERFVLSSEPDAITIL